MFLCSFVSYQKLSVILYSILSPMFCQSGGKSKNDHSYRTCKYVQSDSSKINHAILIKYHIWICKFVHSCFDINVFNIKKDTMQIQFLNLCNVCASFMWKVGEHRERDTVLFPMLTIHVIYSKLINNNIKLIMLNPLGSNP